MGPLRHGAGRAPCRLAALLVVLMSYPGAAASQASPYVPTADPAYRDLDALVASGLVRGVILGQRPYSRVAFARLAAEARESLNARPGPVKARFAEALERLEERFAGELDLLCAPGPDACPRAGTYAALREVRGDAAWATSPARPIRTQLRSGIDADVNPLLQRNQGRALADGWTGGAEGWLDAGLGSRVAAQVQPRLWVADARDRGPQAELTLVRGTVRALLGNLSVDVGRNLVAHGHAREAGPVLSSNARGLDMIRASMERPGRLPWIFRGLGPVGFSAMVADMGRDQDTPGSKLIVLEGAVRPHPNLELGAALVNHQGGGVGPDVGFGERLRDALFLVKRRPFYFLPSSRVRSDKVLAFDARLTVPSRSLEAYLEMMTTDDHDLFWAARQALWHDAAWTGGVRVAGLGGKGRVDAWLEASRVGLLPYTHHEFTSGLAVDRRVLGSPLGPLGTGLLGGVDWTGPGHVLALAGAWERYAGDTYRNPDDGLSRRYRSADNPDEIRVRGTLDWARHPDGAGVRTAVRLGWERVRRFDFTGGTRSNLLTQVTVGYAW